LQNVWTFASATSSSTFAEQVTNQASHCWMIWKKLNGIWIESLNGRQGNLNKRPPHLIIDTALKQISTLVKTLHILHRQTDWKGFNQSCERLNDVLEDLSTYAERIRNERQNN